MAGMPWRSPVHKDIHKEIQTETKPVKQHQHQKLKILICLNHVFLTMFFFENPCRTTSSGASGRRRCPAPWPSCPATPSEAALRLGSRAAPRGFDSAVGKPYFLLFVWRFSDVGIYFLFLFLGCLGPSGVHHLLGRVELCRSVFFRAPGVKKCNMYWFPPA